jgi:hypothetical protein
MNYFRIKSFVWSKNFASVIEIEVIQQRKIPFLQIIGAGDGSKQSQRERVLAAIESAGVRLPARKFVVQVKGKGSFSREVLDLPIALAILGSANQFSAEKIEKLIFLGALALDGRLFFPPDDHFFPILGANMAVVAPLELKNRLNTSIHGHFFSDLASVLVFLKKNEENLAQNFKISKNESYISKIFSRSRLNQHLFLSLSAGLPLFLMDGSAEEVGEVALRSQELEPLFKKFESKEKIQASSVQIMPPIQMIRGDGYKNLFRDFSSLSLHSGSELGVTPLFCLFDLEKKIEKVVDWLEERSFDKSYHPENLRNMDRICIRIIGSGASCFCKQRVKCICRLNETRNHHRNIRAIASHFPLFYDWNRSEELPFQWSFSFEEAKNARKLALERQGYLNSMIPSSEIPKIKPWSFRADQLYRWLKNRLTSVEAEYIAKIALTLSDFRNSNLVEEQNISEGLLYTSNFEGSGFSSGINFPKTSAPAVNSTAIP